VESIPKYGSVFTVRLPNQVKNPLNKDRRLGNYGQDDNLNRTIVIISQDEENSIFLCELLTINNYQVIWLIDDYPPLKQLEVLQPKILIIDQDKNSQIYTLTKQLKQNQTTEGIKILILKTSLQSMHWPFLVENGIDDYLIKPLEPNQLLQKIQLLHSL
jgi:two-component system sensor histidine kinase/response regulator